MSKRKYTHIKSLTSTILSMRSNGYTNQEVAYYLGLEREQIKNCIYRHKPKTLKEANDLIDRYIHFYNYERIQNKTGVAPLTLRHSA